jgi:hypothetical protein
MSYMLLVIEQPGERDVALPEKERRFETMRRFAEDLSARGLLVAGESRTTTSETGVRIRRRDGKRTLVDGPFAEAKEIIGGFFLLKEGSREEAVAIADTCPAAEWSIIEIRELGPCWDGTR